MEPDREGVGTDTPTRSRACTGSSGVEDTGVVPCATGDINTHTTLDPPEEGYDSGHTPREPPSSNPTSSHVGYLRQCYKNCHISKGARKLLLVSWTQNLPKCMTHSLESGSAGALDGTVIPFRDLYGK